MAKRLSEKEKEEIVKCFTLGKTVEELSKVFSCSKLTISRNLKKNLGEKKYKEFIKNNNSLSQLSDESNKNISFDNKNNLKPVDFNENKNVYFPDSPFIEIAPLNCEIDNSKQRDFSSVPISEIELPKVVYMVVDKKIELEIKYLKDYPDWQFLSKDDLNRKTIEIFMDIKNAKRSCNKEQKVIKVPNPEVFKIVAPILISRGISRIVSSDKLIAL